MYKIELTPAEVSHLLTLLRDKQEDGDFYGRKDHYYKRTETIISKLKVAVGGEEE